MVFYLFCFYLICYYFKLRLKRKNSILKLALTNLFSNTNFKLDKVFKNLNNIYIEIHTFNNEFWNKFLFINLSFYISMISFLIFTSIYVNLPWFVKCSYFYFAVFDLLIILTFVTSASSMSSQAEKAELIIHKYFLSKNDLSFTAKFKVIN